jgi:uncharacterized protein (DUF58 family)
VSGAPPLLPAGLVARLAAFDLATRRPSGVLPGGARPAGRAGAGTLFRDHRPYAPGDDLRLLDWHAYARLGLLATKRFESEEAARVVLLLDASASMGHGGEARLRAAARALAVVGALALARGDAVLLVVHPGSPARAFRGRGGLPALLAALEAATPGGTTDLAAAAALAAAAVRGRALAAVASDFLDPAGACAGIDALRRRGWEVRALHAVLPGDLDPPPAGSVVLVDAETGEEREVDLDEGARERLGATAAARVRALRAALGGRGVPWVRLPGGEDPGPLLAALRGGGVLS